MNRTFLDPLGSGQIEYMKKKTIELLRQEQEATKGASDWTRLEEEIQALLDEEE